MYTSHRPLRGSKWNLYEGGIRVPMILRWPGRVPPKTVSRTPVVGYDLLPTFAAAGGAQVDVREEQLDGVDLTSVLEDPTKSLDRPLFWHFPYYHPEGTKYRDARSTIGIDDFAVSRTHPHSAIRRGRFKLIHFPEDDRVELYDLEADPGEQCDLSRDDPSRAARMRGELMEYLDRVEARRATALRR